MGSGDGSEVAGGREASPKGVSWVLEQPGLRGESSWDASAGGSAARCRGCITARQKALLQGVRFRRFGIQLCP